jgi:hypothetical protein
MQIGKESGARIQEPGGGGVWAYRRVGVPVDRVGVVDGVGREEPDRERSRQSPTDNTVRAFFLNIGACRLDRMGKR